MEKKTHNLVVIGAGPGGYVAAIRAAQLGFDTACIEQEEALGGTCLRIGCIPSKALLESSEKFEEAKKSFKRHGIKVGDVELDLPAMLKRKDTIVSGLTKGVGFLFKKNSITRYQGVGSILGKGRVKVSGKDEAEIEAEHIIIATGSSVAPLKGVELDGDRIGTSTEALSYTEVPGELVVIGAGAIGLELGSVWRRLGAKVTVLEYLDRILPGVDLEVANEAQKLLKKQGMKFELGQRVTGATLKGDRVVITRDGGEPVECDRVLLSTGRIPNTEGLDLDKAGVKTGPRGVIEIDEHFKTNVDGIYAIGDVVRGAMLAHKAEEEGIACVEMIATGHGHVNYDAIPGIVYTEPEVASVGKSEEDLKEAGIEYNVGRFKFMANGRAKALNQIDGFVKVIADKETDRLLGVHIVGPRAGDLIAEAAVAIEFKASAEDIARACHAHPTLSEVLKEAALDAGGRAIHA